MKRFYKLVSANETSEGYSIHLDGKPVKTQGGNLLIVESGPIADLLRLEWEAQEKVILPHTMPINQLVMTASDKVHMRDDIIKHIVNFIDTDLVFYRSEAELYRKKQAEIWDKWIQYVEKKFSVVFKKTEQIESLEQDRKFSDSLKNYLEKLNHLQLTIFESLIDDTSSPVLTLAFFEGHAKAQDLYEAVLVEDLIRAEIYDEEKYGVAPDQEKKRATLRRNFDAAEKLIPLI